MILSALVWASLLVVVVAFDIARKPKIKLDFLRFFNIFFAVYFPVQGVLFSLDPAYWSLDKYIVDFDGIYLGTIIFPIVFYIFFLLGYYSSRKIHAGFSFYPNVKKPFPVRRFAFIGLLAFAILVLAYVGLYGGLFEAIAQANALRGGWAERSDYAFLNKFFWLASLVFVVVGSHCIFVSRNKIDYLFLLTSGLGVVLVAILTASRSAMIAPFVYLAIIYVYKKHRLVNLPFILVGFGGLSFLLVGDSFWNFMRAIVTDSGNIGPVWVDETGVAGVLDGLIRNFQAPYVSLQAWYENYSLHDHGLRWGIDYILALMSLVPEKITGLHVPPTIASLNTLLVQGEYKSTVPPGFIAFSLYTMSLPGLIITPFLYGLVGGWLTRFALAHWSVWWVKAGYAVVAFDLAWAQGAGEPRVLLMGNLDVLFMLFFLMALGYLRLRRRGRHVELGS